MKDFHLPMHSRSVLSRIGVVPARQNNSWPLSWLRNYQSPPKTDLFSRRFREGNSFPNFVERSILELFPLQALRCAPCSTEQSTFRGGEKGEKVPRKRREKGWPAKAAKRKKGRVKTGQKRAGKMVPRENCRKVSKNFLTLFDDF